QMCIRDSSMAAAFRAIHPGQRNFSIVALVKIPAADLKLGRGVNLELNGAFQSQADHSCGIKIHANQSWYLANGRERLDSPGPPLKADVWTRMELRVLDDHIEARVWTDGAEYPAEPRQLFYEGNLRPQFHFVELSIDSDTGAQFRIQSVRMDLLPSLASEQDK
ncbi:MAG: hypothetical protein KUG81_04290, partial [Gammaproteobacteria bacterium]|nr:hypothetical protein [Gammaproteobacteria bacterium]